ncbi:flap endonuclease GEN homolog 1 [Daphnia magna]|uniref:Flap endonuclease GEN n=1 Tax=Daphnia magna TaxID=35525 RepID=A0ABR0A7N1_9CRUS|nr:flap endonuclease GEN homolog 1 [Daphnia magna]KAK4021153.1 hypothetical protein OUZ56_003079 [Daphnia magna]
MGVKYLWSIVEPVCKEKPVAELFGKRLAIDTACWVVRDNQVLPSHIPKPHLRNLFFRTASLLENGIDPIYVLEGKAPELKGKVMKKRQEARFGSCQTIASGSASTTQNSTGRCRYKFIQQECKELLTALGVITITSMGEAEAACAGLNRQGAVDGCITVDGDAFLYGAKMVYRNLSTDITNFVCQEYSMDLIETRLNFSRDKLVAMAILFGCDYLPDGVPGVGKESALRVISTWKNGQALEILKSWLSEETVGDSIPLRPAHCSQCKHPGSLRSHAKSGCLHCKTTGGGCKPSSGVCHCEWHLNEIHYEEVAIREKLKRLKELNLEEIFDEFKNENHLERKGGAIQPWQMPCIQTFLDIATKKLKWESHYAAAKVLPLLSRWIIIHGKSQCQKQFAVTPLRILKKRVKRGCPMYEVEWKFNNENETFPSHFNTLEPQFLIEKDFQFLIPIPVPKPLKPSRRKNEKKKIKPFDNVRKHDVVDMFRNMNLETKKKLDSSTTISEDLSLADLSGGTDDSDLSAIVNHICNKKTKSADDGRIPDSDADFHYHEEKSSFTSSPSKSPVLPRDSLGDYMIQKFDLQQQDERPLPNFSLNFSFEKFLETSTTLAHSRLNDTNSAVMFSTPLKQSSNSRENAEQDSFATPSPLAERFSRVRI